MGMLYPKHVKASHINMIRGNPPTWRKNPFIALQHAIMPYSAREKQDLRRREWFLEDGFGYNLIQRTKPQTVGYALADSPIALLAWIYEVSTPCSQSHLHAHIALQKLHDWTDSYPWTDDEILTWISIYYFSTAGPAASVRIYYEATHWDRANPPKTIINRDIVSNWIPIPLGLGFFPKELNIVPKAWARTMGPIVLESVHERGGHFAAWEKPEAIAGDLAKMFGKGGPCFGVVKGADGYGEAPSARL